MTYSRKLYSRSPPRHVTSMAERTVFFVSDRTGVTAETLGHSLLTQFDGITFVPITVPFVDSVEKAVQVARRIDWEAERTGCRPIVFTSFVHNANRAPLLRSRGLDSGLFRGIPGAAGGGTRGQVLAYPGANARDVGRVQLQLPD